MHNDKDLGRHGSLMKAINQAAFFLLDSDIDSFESNLFRAMGIMAEAADVDRMYIWKNHTIDGKLYATQVYEWSEEAEPQQANELTIDISYDEIMSGLEEFLSSNNCLNSIVREMIPEHKAHLSAQGIMSILIVPVFLQDDFWGFVGFDDCHNERLFSEEEETILRSSSLLFAHAYNKNRISREIEEKNEFNRAMFNSAPIGLTVFDDNFTPVDCNDAVLAMYGDISKDFYLNNFFELSPEYQPDGVKSTEKAYEYLKRVVGGEEMKTEWLHKTLCGELIPSEITITHVKAGIGMAGSKHMALVYTYDLRQVKSLETELDGAKNQMYRDALTGVYNRRFFDDTMTHAISALSRSNSKLSLLMLDIDYFKLYNDAYGHQGGDECLKKVAEIIGKCASRAEDFVVRYGGEEFVVVLPNTDKFGARLVAENILKNIRAASIPHKQSPIASYLTASIGVASGTVHHTQSKEEYVKIADEMLYASKQDGRDRHTFRELA
jgi:diguanylate cyclase (GGDEF)-like protein